MCFFNGSLRYLARVHPSHRPSIVLMHPSLTCLVVAYILIATPAVEVAKYSTLTAVVQYSLPGSLSCYYINVSGYITWQGGSVTIIMGHLIDNDRVHVCATLSSRSPSTMNVTSTIPQPLMDVLSTALTLLLVTTRLWAPSIERQQLSDPGAVRQPLGQES